MVRRTRAFTLVEILIVIAIIATLAGILYPVLAHSRLAAKKTVDLSNLKQLGTSVTLYATDNQDTFPLTISGDYSDWPRSTAMWSSSTVTGPYFKGTDLLQTPVDTFGQIQSAVRQELSGTKREPRPLSYMPNAITDFGVKEWGYTGVKGLMPVSKVLIGGTSNPTSMSECESLAQIIMLANGYREFVDSFLSGGPGWVNSEIDFFFTDFGGVYDQFIPKAIRLSLPDDPFYGAWRKFGGGANFVKGDTSADFMAGDQLDDPKYWLAIRPQ